ncbi:hypothetical protein D3C72_2177430 [compost metagenome]
MPSMVEKPMELSRLKPSLIAHMLAPLPRWATTVRALARSGSNFDRAPAMYL